MYHFTTRHPHVVYRLNDANACSQTVLYLEPRVNLFKGK